MATAYEDELIYSNNYVFYDRLKERTKFHRHWDRIRSRAMKEFDQDFSRLKYKDIERLANNLIEQGMAEQVKELNFIEFITGKRQNILKLEEYPAFIGKINKLIGLKDDYAFYLQYMKENIRDVEDKNKGIEGKSRANSAMSYYDSYLTTQLYHNLSALFSDKNFENVIRKAIELDNNDLIKEKMTEIIEKSIQDSLKKIANEREDKLLSGEARKIWGGMAALLDETTTIYKELSSVIYERYHLEEMSKEIYKVARDRKLKGIGFGDGTKFRGEIEKNYKINEKEKRQIGGLLEEFVNAAFYIGETKTGNFTVKSEGKVVSKNLSNTDEIAVYTANMKINTDKLLKELNEALTAGTSKIDINKNLNQFYKDHLDKLDNTYIIYESSKVYGLGQNFRGFHGAQQRAAQLGDFFEEFGGKREDGLRAQRLLFNIMPGAIEESKATETKQNITKTLSEYMAYFLFDDWRTLGKQFPKDKGIHLFSLNSVKVPLSFLLIGAGNALLDTNKDKMHGFFKTSYTLGKIKYPNTIHLNKDENILQYWNDQREEAEKQVKFTITFLGNFKSLLQDLIKYS